MKSLKELNEKIHKNHFSTIRGTWCLINKTSTDFIIINSGAQETYLFSINQFNFCL